MGEDDTADGPAIRLVEMVVVGFQFSVFSFQVAQTHHSTEN